MLFDTHAHVNFNAYKNDADEVIRRSLDSGIWMINVGSQYETSKRAIELAEKHEGGIYAAIGMHPIHVETGVFKPKMEPEEILADKPARNASHSDAGGEKEQDFDVEKYKELTRSRKVVAVGEIGLDYYYRPKTKTRQEIFKQKQKEIFLKQLELAKEFNLPVIFHCRAAHNDLIEVLKSEIRNSKSETNPKSQIQNSKLRGVIHCFTGSWEQAQKYLEMGFYLGINGIIYKMDLHEVIEKTPLEKILLETDCPYLTPPPATLRKRACSRSDAGGAIPDRNEPIFVKYIVEEVAKIKNISFEKVAEVTTQNAKNLFRI